MVLGQVKCLCWWPIFLSSTRIHKHTHTHTRADACRLQFNVKTVVVLFLPLSEGFLAVSALGPVSLPQSFVLIS